jgi:hypothetical protein
MPTVFAKHLNQEIRAPVDHSGVIQEVVRHVHHPGTLTIRETRSRDPNIERICDKRLSRASRAWAYASSSVTPRPTFPGFCPPTSQDLVRTETRDRPLYVADEIGNGRSRGRQNDSRASEPFLRAGSGEEASYCPGQWRTPMAPSLHFDISCQKNQQST